MSRAKFGGDITSDIEDVLRKAPSPDEIFENMESFNEEIEDANKLVEQEISQNIKPVQRNLKPRVNVKNITPEKQQVRESNEPVKIQQKRETMSEKTLEQDLMKFEQTMKPAEPTQEELNELSRRRIREALDKLGGPTEKQINSWKAEVGKDGIHITIFSDEEMYVYTHLTRAMWQQVQKMLDKMRESKDTVKEEELRELVVKHCVKWPLLTAEWKYHSRAGVVDSLFESIWYHSYFFTPQQVQSLTTQL